MAQPDQMSPGCHAQEMRLEHATDTGIEGARWGVEVVPGVSMCDRGGSSKPSGSFTSLAAELYCSSMRGLQCDYRSSHGASFFTRVVHLHLTPSRVRNPVSHAVSFDNATSARNVFHRSECDTLPFSCTFFTLYIVCCGTRL